VSYRTKLRSVLSAVRVQDQGDQEEKSDTGNLGGRVKGDATKEEGNRFSRILHVDARASVGSNEANPLGSRGRETVVHKCINAERIYRTEFLMSHCCRNGWEGMRLCLQIGVASST